MYNVYQHWDPLEICVVGKAYPPEFYNWIKHTSTREKFEKLAIETEEDLQNLILLLKKFNIEVLRPEIPENFEHCWHNGIAIPPPVTPRDFFITIHNSFYVPIVPNLNHAIKAFQNQKTKTWEEFYKDDQEKHKKKLKFYSNIFKKVKNSNTSVIETELDYISGCWVSRIGKDLFFATQSVHDDWDLILNQVNNMFPSTNNHIVDSQGHGDAMYCPIAPGLIISTTDEDYKNSFPNWEVVYLDPSHYAKHEKFQTSMKLNSGKWYIPEFEKNSEIITTVDRYFNEWVGQAHETVFGVNILCIDSKNIVVSEHNDLLESACSRYGIDIHVVPFKHKYFWDAGIHCVTNDLHRKSKLECYNL
jgi:hypothetical protein